MSMTLPADLYIPEVAMETFTEVFSTSLQALNFMGTGPMAPVRITGFDTLKQGGQFVHAEVLDRTANLESRRDLTSESDVTPVKFTSRDDTGVLLNRKIGPASKSLSAEQLGKIGPGVLDAWFGAQAARSVMETIQSCVINAMYGAIAALGSTAHTRSVWAAATRTNLDTALIAETKALLGDRAAMITAMITRSEPYYRDLVINQLGAGVSGIADRVSGGGAPHTLGLDWAVVDDAILTAADAGFDKYRTLLLGPGAVEIEFTQPLVLYPPWMNLKAENVEVIFRGDYSFGLRVGGMAFSTGTANPTAANLSTGGNWTDNTNDHREFLLAMAEHNYSGN